MDRSQLMPTSSGTPLRAQRPTPLGLSRPGARTAVALVCVAAIATGLALAAHFRRGDRFDGAVHIDRGGYRYAYHPVTGDEALFDIRNDPRLLRNLIRSESARAAELRRALERACGVESLEQLRAAHRAQVEALEALGYL
ncbi:MAG: hypothetical protein K8T90_06550 [Planctomycetes bacterium]|nr:hypothetical protein [Planctomycetota bacterium]